MPLPADTAPEIRTLLLERYARMAPAERLAMAAQMLDTARALALASFPPGLEADEVRRRLCERFYGPDLARRALGPGRADEDVAVG